MPLRLKRRRRHQLASHAHRFVVAWSRQPLLLRQVILAAHFVLGAVAREARPHCRFYCLFAEAGRIAVRGGPWRAGALLLYFAHKFLLHVRATHAEGEAGRALGGVSFRGEDVCDFIVGGAYFRVSKGGVAEAESVRPRAERVALLAGTSLNCAVEVGGVWVWVCRFRVRLDSREAGRFRKGMHFL